MEKSADAFRTISEVAEELDLPQHVLRFGETRFTQIKPLKRGGGRRYYRPDDVELLRAIRRLLYGEGYTIKGVQRLLRENGARAVTQMPGQEPSGPIPAIVKSEADWDEEDTAETPSDWGETQQPPSERPHANLASVPRGLLKNDILQLRSALADLDECERILAAVRATSGQSIHREAWSEWRDSNPRPLVPQTSALTGLRYTPTGRFIEKHPGPRNPTAVNLARGGETNPRHCRAESFCGPSSEIARLNTQFSGSNVA